MGDAHRTATICSGNTRLIGNRAFARCTKVHRLLNSAPVNLHGPQVWAPIGSVPQPVHVHAFLEDGRC